MGDEKDKVTRRRRKQERPTRSRDLEEDSDDLNRSYDEVTSPSSDHSGDSIPTVSTQTDAHVSSRRPRYALKATFDDDARCAPAQRAVHQEQPREQPLEADVSAKEKNMRMKKIIQLFNEHKNNRQVNYFGKGILEELRANQYTDQPLLDMALAVESASQVYGFRVDITAQHCLETTSICRGAVVTVPGVGGCDDADKKKKKKGDEDGENYQARMANLMSNMGKEDQGLGGGFGADDQGDDSDAEDMLEVEEMEKTQKQKNDARFAVTRRWGPDDDILEILEAERQERKLQILNSTVALRNSKLVSDLSSLHVKRKEQRQNPYYAKVVYNVNRRVNDGLFSYNAEATSDGRRLILHPRTLETISTEPEYNKAYTKDFLDSIAGLCDNALSGNPQSYNNFFPRTYINNKDKAIAVEDEEFYDMEVDELSEDIITNDREQDDTVLPDRTVMDGTMANQTLAFQGKAGTKRVTLKGLGEKQVRIPDRFDAFANKSSDAQLASALGALVSQTRSLNNGFSAEEFHMTLSTREELGDKADKERIVEETKHMRLMGLGSHITEFERTWHAEYVKVVVTKQDEETQEKTIKDSKPQAQWEFFLRNILKQGKYKMFAAPADYPHNYPRDPTTFKELKEIVLEFQDRDVNLDLDDDNLAMPDVDFDVEEQQENRREPTDEEIQAEIDAVMEGLDEDKNKHNERPATVLRDDGEEAHVFEAQTVELEADADLRRLGKEDDQHWKLGKEPDVKKKEPKKEKKEKPVGDDSYYFLPYEELRRLGKTDVFERFEKYDTEEEAKKALLVDPEKIFTKTRKERKTQTIYDFSRFFKPSLLWRGRYGKCSCEPMRQPIKPSRRLVVDEAGEGEKERDAFVDFLLDFCCYDVERRDDANESTLTMNEKPETSIRPYERGHAADTADKDRDTGTAGFEDEDDIGFVEDVGDGVIDGMQEDGRVDARLPKHEMSIRELRHIEDVEIPTHDLNEYRDCKDIKKLEEMLELAKRAKQQRVDTLQVKVAIKGLLSNRFLEERLLVRTAHRVLTPIPPIDEETDVIDRQPLSPSKSDKENHQDVEMALADVAEGRSEKKLEEGVHPRLLLPPEPPMPDDVDVDDDAVADKISEALNAPPVDLESEEFEQVLEPGTQIEGGAEKPKDMNASLRVRDFQIEGEHTFASVFSCLQHRLPPQDQQVHVATALVIALHMCNENGIVCEQQRPSGELGIESGEWMNNFVFRNGREDEDIDDV